MKKVLLAQPGSSIKEVSVVFYGGGSPSLLVRGDMGVYLMSLDEVRSALRLCSFSVVDPIFPGLPVLVTCLPNEK